MKNFFGLFALITVIGILAVVRNYSINSVELSSRTPASVPPLAPLDPSLSVTDDHSVLQSPMNYQVFQRKTLERGTVILNLRILPSTVNAIRVQVFDAQNLPLLASELAVNLRQGEIYQNSFELPAGGWYRLQVEQVSTANRIAYRSIAHPFGIGDVFVTAGQSNATSAGEDLTFTNTRMVSAYVPKFSSDGHLIGPGSWQLNNDPQPPESLPTEAQAAASGYARNNFGSVWPTMGDDLASRQNIPIATAECGVGGTTIAQWQKDHVPTSGLPIYTRLMETTKILAETTGVRMILWDQGESDNLSEAQTFPLEVYGNQFKKLQADLAADVGQSFPWMIAKASFAPANGHLNDSGPCDSLTANDYYTQQGSPLYTHSIRLALEKLISDRNAFEGPDTDKYIGAGNRYPGKRGACIHFSKTAQVLVGRDWAEQILKTRFGEFPDGSAVSQTGDLKVQGPNCPVTGNCRVTLNWNNPTIQSSQLRVFMVGQSTNESLVGCLGSNGSITVDWIVPRYDYRFGLYSSTACDLSTPAALIDQKIVRASTPVGPPPPPPVPSPSPGGSLPAPTGMTPVLVNSGRGCADNLCLWFIVKNIESDFRIDMRKINTTSGIDWTYQQNRLTVATQPDGSYAMTLRLSEFEAQEALKQNGIRCWIVNPTSSTWTDGTLVQ